MKLSELEALAASATLYGDGDIYCIYTSDPNDLLEFCATFRGMLVIMQELPHGEYCKALKGPVNYGWVEENECDCGRNAAIRKAEEML